ncbi:MAG: hypothetical protein PUF29_16645 [Anaerobutyricum hallii]|uniref:hypothetical protein n=1 Tax=Anaerobutyricum hallii TaxID=39488 RepID=UPI00242B39B6|nr:hypothetical protein [Anaerobutyricum hallii]MDD6590187.1 hypothetical protein [Anaerobutyricum hallii]
MKIVIPYLDKEQKSDIQLNFVTNNRAKRGGEDDALKRLADYFVNCNVEYRGSYNRPIVSINKTADSLIINIDGEINYIIEQNK